MGSAIRISTIAFVLALALPVGAETYWLRYEGDDFPENQGWTHSWNEPNAVRWIAGGALVIDAREEQSTCDWYQRTLSSPYWPYPDVMFPEPASQFFTQWRVKIEDYSGASFGPGIAVYFEDGWGVSFGMSGENIRATDGSGLAAQFESGLFHEFEVRSPDLQTYELYIDGLLAFGGSFHQTAWSNAVFWGEQTTSSSSLTRWDCFRIGVAPEPGSGMGGFVLLIGALMARRGTG